MATAEDKGTKSKATKRKPRSTARIQIRGPIREVWHHWVQKWRKKNKKAPFAENKGYDYMFSKAAKAHGSTGEEFQRAKQFYVEKFGQLELMQMLKKNLLHTTRPRKFQIVAKLLKELPRQESDSEEELSLQKQQKKRKTRHEKKKMQFAWLPTMAKEFATNLWPLIEEHLPTDITVERLAEFMLPDVC